MKWYGKAVKKAELGHGDTLDGQMMDNTFKNLEKEVTVLRMSALEGGPHDVLPRWQGELRRAMLLLPPMDRIERMSMGELLEVRDKVDKIKADMDRYSQKKFMALTGDRCR
jgi:hypothetical protein